MTILEAKSTSVEDESRLLKNENVELKAKNDTLGKQLRQARGQLVEMTNANIVLQQEQTDLLEEAHDELADVNANQEERNRQLEHRNCALMRAIHTLTAQLNAARAKARTAIRTLQYVKRVVAHRAAEMVRLDNWLSGIDMAPAPPGMNRDALDPAAQGPERAADGPRQE